MFSLEQRLAALEAKLVEAQRNREMSEAQLSRQDRLVNKSDCLYDKIFLS